MTKEERKARSMQNSVRETRKEGKREMTDPKRSNKMRQNKKR